MNDNQPWVQQSHTANTPAGPHLVVFIGIFIFLAPFLAQAMKLHLWNGLKTVGLVVIFIGVGLTILRELL